MELYQLQCFYEVARELNITKAARKLSVSQPALSKTINRLEADLGAALFDRKAKSIVLNEYGLALLERTESIFAAMDDIKLNIEDIHSGSVGKIRIGSTLPSSESSWLLDCIRDFMLKNPKVTIKQRHMHPEELQDAILNNKIDIAIGGSYLDIPELNCTELYSSKLGVLVSKENEMSDKSSISLTELSDQIFFSNNSNTDLENLLYSVCGIAGFEPEVTLSSNYSRMIGELIAANKGITLIPVSVYLTGSRYEQTADTVTMIELEEDYCVLREYAAISKDRYVPNSARKLYQAIVEYAGNAEK